MKKSKIFYCEQGNGCPVVSLTITAEENKPTKEYKCPHCGSKMSEMAFVTAGLPRKKRRKKF